MDYDLEMLIDVKGWRALGNKLSVYEVKDLKLIVSEPAKAEEQVEAVLEGEEEEEEERTEEVDNDLEIGSTIDLTPKKGDEEQLGLF
jgi:topoisomerase-4 subunit A